MVLLFLSLQNLNRLMFTISNGDPLKGKESLGKGWRKYNNELVVRGALYLDFSFMENWKEELEDE